MTLGDAKRKVLMLLDEYSTGGTVVQTNDSAVADINHKMNDFFDMAQKDIINAIPIIGSVTYTLDGTAQYKDVPDDFKKYLRVWKDGAYRKKYPVINGKFNVNYESGTIIIEYIKTPETIDQDTADTYEFEVSEEAANCLPYYVAAQQLITDLVVDYTALWNMYLYHKQLLDTSLVADAGNGGIRQTLFGR